MEIKSSKSISISQTKEILEQRKKDNELGYEQSQALEHAEKFSTHSSKKAQDIVDELMEGGKINLDLAIKIVDVSPTNPSSLRAIAAKDKIELSDEEVEKILKTVA